MSAELQHESPKTTDRLRELVAVNRALVSTLDYEEVLRLVVEKTAAVTRADSCVLLLVGPDDLVRVSASLGVDEEKAAELKAPLDERINVVLRDLLGFSEEDLFLGVPVIDQGRIKGLLVVYRRGPTLPDEEAQFVVRALADQAAIALDHASRYRELSRISEQKSRLLETISNTATALAYLDPQLRFVEANAAYCAAFGRSRGELVGRSYRELFADPGLRARLDEVRSTGSAVEISELCCPAHDDGDRDEMGCAYWDWSARPVSGEFETVEGVVISAIDVTEKVLARRELEAAGRRKDEFLAMLAHELRNPLAAISSAVEVLQARLPDDASVGRVRGAARRQIGHMTRLLDDLLDVSRITRGKITLRRETVYVDSIIQQALQAVEPVIHAAGHEVSVTLPPERVAIDGDSDRLVQVICNLLTNAAKYTPPNGSIWVEVRREGDDVRIAVRDDGMGIAPELLPHVFDLFTQSDRTLDRTQGGLGVGLTIVKQLVGMHGGCVEAYSEGPNRGSEFVIVLPALAGSEAQQGDEGSGEQGRATGRRVLVVEDNRDTAETLAALLELEGHQVYLALDGPTALAMAKRAELDVVLLDIGLPGMDGHEVARRLGEESESRGRMRIIALTGYGGEEHRTRAEKAGIDDFLVKPVDRARLRRALST